MVLKSAARPVVGLVLVSVLAGCSLLEDRSLRYSEARERAPLTLPEGVQGDRLGQALPIRDVDSADAGRMYRSGIPKPPDMTSEILDENYVIEELDGQVWLLVNDVPGRVWPAVNAYMNERGLGVAEDSPQLGVMQSELVNFSKRARELLQLPDDVQGEEPKVLVQARITPGVRRKTTEIQLRPREVEDSPSELLPWESGEDAGEAEKEQSTRLLNDLAEFLKEREDTKSYSRAALGITSDPRVRLVSEGETPVAVRMSVAYDRAWAETRRALGDADIPVVDLDRSEGQFYVDFRTEDERKPGFFSWFSDDPKPEYTFHVKLERQDDAILVTTGKAEGYSGPDRSASLLSTLFDYLY